jgi:hypothetical protein
LKRILGLLEKILEVDKLKEKKAITLEETNDENSTLQFALSSKEQRPAT